MSKTCDNAVFTFGRFNPPTTGHQRLVEKIKSIPGDHYIFLSHTNNTKTDPLPFQIKKRFVELFFEGVSVGDKNCKTIIQVLQHLESMGYKKVTMVVGSDRVDDFRELLNNYNGRDFCFTETLVESAGVRDPDGAGLDAVSASRQREAVLQGNIKEFSIGVPNAKYMVELFDAVRQGLTDGFK